MGQDRTPLGAPVGFSKHLAGPSRSVGVGEGNSGSRNLKSSGKSPQREVAKTSISAMDVDVSRVYGFEAATDYVLQMTPI
ncbi:hypothetical protein MDA_GLEAN10013798 [Myotis davidii]|uniref:Uncharacterized protein n=1 Tax=Myotis davidii TaxID=225400 RepID=L5M7W3_MYODS|nr:hypothetical protein MDA_GLEAN10013798 [Myotis davidii]